MELHAAVRAGDLDKIRAMLAAGADIEARDAEGYTPLMLAAKHAEGDAFRLLLDAGADMHATNAQEMNVLFVAATQGVASMVRTLIDKGADVNHEAKGKLTPLMGAIMGEHTDIARLLIEAGADPHAKDKDGSSVGQWANKLGRKDIAEFIKKAAELVTHKPSAGKARLQARDLIQAARTGDVEDIRACLQAGVPIESHDAEGYSALMIAAQANKRHAIETLLSAGADPYAAAKNGYNPLLCAANSVEALQPFRKAGVNLNHANHTRGLTPVMFAAQQGFGDVVRFLIDAGVDVSLADKFGQTALDRAKRNGQKKIEAILREKLGLATPTHHGEVKPPQHQKQQEKQAGRKLCKAAAKGDLEGIRALLAEGVPVDARDRDDYTPLMRGAEHGQREACQLLLEAGANPAAAADNTGADALYMACGGGHLNIARDLIARGVPVNPKPGKPNHVGYTPLMAAVLSGNLELVQFLIEAGADVNAKTDSDDSALKWAREFKQKKIYAYLKQHGAQPKTRVATAAHPLPAAAVPADPTNPMQVIRAAVKNFPIAAAQPSFQDALKAVSQAAGKTPNESDKRPGVYLLSLGRKHVDALAEHYQLAKPSFKKKDLEEDTERTRAILERLQDEIRAHGFLLMLDTHWSVEEAIKLRLYPTNDAYAVIAACGTNGANYGISPAKIIGWLRKLAHTHPFVLTACGHDYLAGNFLQSVRDAGELARKMYKFCPDIVEQGTNTVRALAQALAEDQSFFFWWD